MHSTVLLDALGRGWDRALVAALADALEEEGSPLAPSAHVLHASGRRPACVGGWHWWAGPDVRGGLRMAGMTARALTRCRVRDGQHFLNLFRLRLVRGCRLFPSPPRHPSGWDEMDVANKSVGFGALGQAVSVWLAAHAACKEAIAV